MKLIFGRGYFINIVGSLGYGVSSAVFLLLLPASVVKGRGGGTLLIFIAKESSSPASELSGEKSLLQFADGTRFILAP